jgi:hypothetical protein
MQSSSLSQSPWHNPNEVSVACTTITGGGPEGMNCRAESGLIVGTLGSGSNGAIACRTVEGATTAAVASIVVVVVEALPVFVATAFLLNHVPDTGDWKSRIDAAVAVTIDLMILVVMTMLLVLFVPDADATDEKQLSL